MLLCREKVLVAPGGSSVSPGGSLWLLAAPGDSWWRSWWRQWLLVAAGGLGGSWWLLVSPGGFWWPFVALEDFWWLLVTHGGRTQEGFNIKDRIEHCG